MSYFDFAMIGGDQRQHYLHKLLLKQNYSVICYGIRLHNAVNAVSLEEAVCSSQKLIAPIPFSKDGISLTQSPGENPVFINKLMELLHSKHTIIAGNIPSSITSRCHCIDLMKQEKFITANSIATAEAAAAIAILQFPDNLQECQCLITGYGHCAKALAQCLDSLHAVVTIAARSPYARKEAMQHGFHAIDLLDLKPRLASFSILFNTIPFPVFSKEMVMECHSSTLYLELASTPGGLADISYAKEKLSVVSCPGLPGRFAPFASAKAIFNCLI